MRLHVDQDADGLYPRLDDSVIVESEEVSPSVVPDNNESNEVGGGGNIPSLALSRQLEPLDSAIRDAPDLGTR